MLKSRLLSAVSITTLVALSAADVLAQLTVEEIVVTARRRAETLQSVPLSVTAFSAEQIENRGIDSLINLAAQTPGMVFGTAANITSNRPIIRGMTQQTRVGDEVNTATFVDGVYSSGFSGTEFSFDGVERVEVVRGPQSALYGRNSFAGAINYVTKKPGDTPEFGARATIGDHGRWGVGAYASSPLVEDQLGARLDAGYSVPGGTLRNIVDGKRLNNRKTGFARLGVTANPSEIVDVFGSLSYAGDRGSGTAVTAIPDNSPRRVGKPPATTRSPNQIGRLVAGPIRDESATFSFDPLANNGDRDSYRGILSITVDLGAANLIGLSGYEKRKVQTRSDLDTTPAGTPFPTVLVQNLSGANQKRHEWSQDIRLESKEGERLKWVAGFYYSDEYFNDASVRYSIPGQGNTSPPPTANGQPSVNERSIYKTEFTSVYGLAGYGLTDQFDVSIEGRYTWESKSANNVEINFGSAAAAGPLGLNEGKFKYFAPRAIASFKPDNDVLLYMSVSKGIKSGGFNPEAPRPDERRYEPESNWTYEAGAKLTMWDRRAVMNASAYHIDWTNQQTLQFARDLAGNLIVSSIIGNVAKSRVQGVELQANLVPTDFLKVDLGYSLSDAKYKSALLSNLNGFVDCAVLKIECAVQPGSALPRTTGRVDGKRLENTAKHTFAGGVEILVPISDEWNFYSRADLSYNSRKYQDAANVGWVPANSQVQARVGIENDSTKFQLFCNNLTNNRTPVTAFGPRDFLGTPHYFATNRDGRICGLTVAVSN